MITLIDITLSIVDYVPINKEDRYVWGRMCELGKERSKITKKKADETFETV